MLKKSLNTRAKGTIPDSKILIYVTSESHSITGSNTLIDIVYPETNENAPLKKVRFMVDYGLIQDEAYQNENGKILYNAEEIDFVICTHAHTDHVGLLPYLLKRKYQGKVYCSQRTKDYIKTMLDETASIMENDYKREINKNRRASENSKKNKKNGKPGKKDKIQRDKDKKPKGCFKGKKRKEAVGKQKREVKEQPCIPKMLYSKEDIKDFMRIVYSTEYCKTFTPEEGVEVTFYENGHVDGSVITVIRAFDQENETYFLVTGDIGVENTLTGMKSIVPKSLAEKISFVISEATYGSAEFVNVETEKVRFKEIIKRAYNEQKRIVCPWYAFERPIVGMKEIDNLKNDPEMSPYLEHMPIYFDSKLGIKFMKVMQKKFKEEDLEFLENTRLVQTADERKALKIFKTPYIVFLTSGRFNQGSILAYPEFLEDSKTIFLFGGYVPPKVQNYMALEKSSTIRFGGEDLKLNAKMESVKCFSAHMQKHELLEFLSQFKKAKTIMFHHGEDEAKMQMSVAINDAGIAKGHNLLYGKTVIIENGEIIKIF